MFDHRVDAKEAKDAECDGVVVALEVCRTVWCSEATCQVQALERAPTQLAAPFVRALTSRQARFDSPRSTDGQVKILA
jgi:hypothetical protein